MSQSANRTTPSFAWSARCDCRNNHNSSSGRCNVRDVTDVTRAQADNFAACERCRRECPCGAGNWHATTIFARDLAEGQLIFVNKDGEKVEAVTRKGNHVYAVTDYTRTTGAGGYDFDKMQRLDLLTPRK